MIFIVVYSSAELIQLNGHMKKLRRRHKDEITEIRQRALDCLAMFAESNDQEDLAAKYQAESQKISQQLGS